VASIAAAIEEQSAVSKDIARNITEASIGVGDANERVAQSSQVSKGMAVDIGTVDRSVSEIADSSGWVKSSAEDLARVSGELQATVERFRI